jgi:predicted nucleic acid-binding protein
MFAVVADSSSLIHLAGIDRLGLLRTFYGRIFIPPAVWQEVVSLGKGRAGQAEVCRAVNEGWIVVEAPVHRPTVPITAWLHPGESEAIRLALAKNAQLLLMDEKEGRSEFSVQPLACRASERGLLEGFPPRLRPRRAATLLFNQDCGCVQQQGALFLERCLPLPCHGPAW